MGTVFRNWHPGPLGFQIAADAFAYVYTTGLMNALDIIEEDMNAGVNLLDRWFDNDRRRQLHQLPPLGKMAEPLFCDPLYCSTPHPPLCLNYEKPTFGEAGISVRSQSNWTIWHEPNGWNHMVGKVDTAIIKRMHDPEWEQKCAHLDACGAIRAQDSTHGTLTFELPSSKMTAGLVFVCGCCGKQVGEAMFIQNENVTIKLNGRTLDKTKMDVYPNGKCARLFQRFGEDGYEKEDTMRLSFEMAYLDPLLTSYEANRNLVQISHVVAL